MGWLDDSFFKEERRFCPKCHEAFFPGECDIVATFPAAERGKILHAAPKGSWLAKKKPRKISSEDIRKHLATRLCPECGYFLPRNIDTTPLLNIVVAGDLASGKSHYIAALIRQLRAHRVVPDEEFFRMICMTPLMEAYYNQNYFGKLFAQHTAIDRTPPGTVLDPLIYELTFKRGKEFFPQAVNIAIHDAAGGDYGTEEKIVEFTQHVINARAMIYLANPVAMPDIEKNLPSEVDRQGSSRSPSETLTTIIHLIEDFRGLPVGSGLADLPIAITISKSDLLEKLRPNNGRFVYSFKENPEYRGGVNLADLDEVEKDVLEVLSEHAGDRSLIPSTKTIERKRFLAISATGWPPEASGSYPNVEPRRCLDPLLWILYELGLIPESEQP